MREPDLSDLIPGKPQQALTILARGRPESAVEIAGKIPEIRISEIRNRGTALGTGPFAPPSSTLVEKNSPGSEKESHKSVSPPARRRIPEIHAENTVFGPIREISKDRTAGGWL